MLSSNEVGDMLFYVYAHMLVVKTSNAYTVLCLLAFSSLNLHLKDNFSCPLVFNDVGARRQLLYIFTRFWELKLPKIG